MVLKHASSGKLLIVGNTHLYWDDRFDYVKYAQAFSFLQALQKMRLIYGKDVPIVVGADMNCAASSSAIHLMMGQQYLLNKASGRCDPVTGHRAYMTKEGGIRFDYVDRHVQQERADLPVFASAYQSYRKEMLGETDKYDVSQNADLLEWAKNNEESHP